MSILPPAGSGLRIVFLVLSITVITFVALSPVEFFRMLSWGRPLPKLINNRWVRIYYRVTALGILVWLLQMLFQLFTK
jgi:hypothetical protein